jgi:hypothetical protein
MVNSSSHGLENLCVSSNLDGKRYVLLCDNNLQLQFRSSVMLVSSETSVSLCCLTWSNTSEDVNLYCDHCEDIKEISQLVVTCKLHKVRITAVTVQVVTACSREGQLCDYVFTILLVLETDLPYSDCVTCHSASGYYDLQAFPARCCQ